jgi:hypothetical protein
MCFERNQTGGPNSNWQVLQAQHIHQTDNTKGIPLAAHLRLESAHSVKVGSVRPDHHLSLSTPCKQHIKIKGVCTIDVL